MREGKEMEGRGRGEKMAVREKVANSSRNRSFFSAESESVAKGTRSTR